MPYTLDEQATYALRAEARALLSGIKPRATVDSSGNDLWIVRADTDPWNLGAYVVRLVSHRGPGRLMRFSCECPSGKMRRDLPVPCRHAAITARTLEVARLAKWRDGLWYHPGVKPTPVQPDDPFKGLQS